MTRRPLLLSAALLSATIPGLAQETPADWSLPPLSGLTAIVERPLFDPARRGTQAAAAPVATATAPALTGGDRLLGLIRRQGQALAMLSLGGQVLSLAPGQEAGGWHLLAIDPDAARFSTTDGRTFSLTVGASLPSATLSSVP
jgi:hypothetical protein